MNNSHLDHEDEVKSRTTIREVIRRLWPYFMKQKLLFFTTLASVFAVAAAARCAVALFGYAIDNGILKSDRGIIMMAAIGYAILETSRITMEFFESYLFSKLGNRILFEIRERLVDHAQSLPIAFFDRHPAGRIVTRLTNDVVSLGELFTQGLIALFAAGVSLIAIVVAMTAISLKMTLLTVLVAPPLVFIIAILSRKILLALRDAKAKLAAINAFVAENINGMRILQLYGRVRRNSNRFLELSGEYRSYQLKTVRLYAMLWPLTSFFNAASVVTALYVGGKLSVSGGLTTGAMVAFILNVRAFMDPLQVILEKFQVFQNCVSGAERVFTLMDESPETNRGAVLKPRKLQGAIEFRDLEFRYRPELKPALIDFNLHVKAGESVALVGRTGSGKSTMISLLQRLYDPSKGDILIDGVPIMTIPRRDLRARVGVVQQDTFMFRGTVADNIGLGDKNISRDRMIEASNGARLDEILDRHHGGLDAKVEERGANLSFGERQLIAFARILAFDPDILILDEATSNIDSHTEQLIQEATRRVRRGRTSFIIAHRISTILDCDKIVVIDHGRIIEIGSHRELYAKAGAYRQLCDAQFNEAAKPNVTI
jgi:ATP-binding cassette subfamily B multidrug efflux pump